MERKQRMGSLRAAAIWSAIYTTVGIVVSVLIAVGLSGWDGTVFLQIFARLWYVFCVVLGVAVGLSVLAAWKPQAFPFAGLLIVGFLLLFASAKGTLINQYLGGWIYENWDMNLFSASITILSLAFAVGAIAMMRRSNRGR